jgi:hypothetical protein
MSEMSNDPVTKLGKFTPATSLDPAELLFAAGRASARTPWGWKAAVAGLLLTNTLTLTLLALRPQAHVTQPEPPPAPVVPPAQQPGPPQPSLPADPIFDEPWSYGALSAVGDPDRFPKSEPIAGAQRPEAPLTVLSARRGEID